jgi:hypothetical protein
MAWNELQIVAWLGRCQAWRQQHNQQHKEATVKKLSAMRRVVPSGYRVYELTLNGVTPLLMSSGEADRESDTYIAYRQLSKKRGKTVEDESRLRELEWYTRIYYDDKIGCYVPGKNVKEMIRSAATKWRKGEDVKRSLIIPEYRIPLIYDGPRTPSELWHEGYQFTAMVANAGAGSGRVERCRPCFDTWSIKTEIAFDPEDISDHEVELFVSRSEKYGLGDYRPDFGSFRAELSFARVQREDAHANGNKPRNKRAEAANMARAKALLGTA